MVVEVRKQQSALVVERSFGVRVKAFVRVGDAAREGEPARDRPDDDQEENDERCDADPAAPVWLAATPRRPDRGTRPALRSRRRRRGSPPRSLAAGPAGVSMAPSPWRDHPDRREHPVEERPAARLPADHDQPTRDRGRPRRNQDPGGADRGWARPANRGAGNTDDLAGRGYRRSCRSGPRAAARRRRHGWLRSRRGSTTSPAMPSRPSTSRCGRSISSKR